MNAKETPLTTVDEYIKSYPMDIQERLTKFREVIKEAAPDATELINYGVPTFKLNGNLVHFGGAKKHIGFYPAPSGITPFLDELKDFETSKGAIQFPHSKPIPWELVKKITKFRVNENLEKKK